MTAGQEPAIDVIEQMRRDIDRTLLLFMTLAFGVGLAVGWSAEPMRRYVHGHVGGPTPPTLERDATRTRVCVLVAAPRGRLCAEWIRLAEE